MYHVILGHGPHTGHEPVPDVIHLFLTSVGQPSATAKKKKVENKVSHVRGSGKNNSKVFHHHPPPLFFVFFLVSLVRFHAETGEKLSGQTPYMYEKAKSLGAHKQKNLLGYDLGLLAQWYVSIASLGNMLFSVALSYWHVDVFLFLTGFVGYPTACRPSLPNLVTGSRKVRSNKKFSWEQPATP